jgi:hypothetical protein
MVYCPNIWIGCVNANTYRHFDLNLLCVASERERLQAATPQVQVADSTQ